MGYGAFMIITNSTGAAITTTVEDVQCMYDNGQEGSDLSSFNTTIPAGQSTPTAYIEAIASGACAFISSAFTLVVAGVGLVNFVESEDCWSAPSATGINPVITNGDQARITVTVYPT